MSDHIPNQDPIFGFFRCIHIIQQLSQTRVEKVLPNNMLLSHFSVLSHLQGVSTSNPAKLAEVFQVARPSMTNTLTKLEKAKFIRISPDPNDGRAKHVTITEKGRNAQLEAIAAIKPVFADLLEAIHADTFIELLPKLNEIKSYLDQNRT